MSGMSGLGGMLGPFVRRFMRRGPAAVAAWLLVGCASGEETVESEGIPCNNAAECPTGFICTLDRALGEGGALDLLRDNGAERLERWLAGAATPDGGVVEIRLRSGDPEDLTLREARLLGSADVLACEPGVATAVLDRARADAVRVLLEHGGAPPDGDGLVVVLRGAVASSRA